MFDLRRGRGVIDIAEGHKEEEEGEKVLPSMRELQLGVRL